jgi:hypothetical protein
MMSAVTASAIGKRFFIGSPPSLTGPRFDAPLTKLPSRLVQGFSRFENEKSGRANVASTERRSPSPKTRSGYR